MSFIITLTLIWILFRCKITRLPRSIYFESYAIANIFPKDFVEWDKYQYVGTFSWKFHEKLSFKLKDIPRLMDYLHKNNIDVVGFFYPEFRYNNLTMMQQADLPHPKFSAVWKPLMESFGDRFTTEQIVGCCANEFYANYFVAKINMVQQLCNFTKEIHRRLDTIPAIQNDLWSDSTYYSCGSDDTQLRSIFNRTYYTYHPFVLERITPFYFNSINASSKRAQNIAKLMRLRLRFRFSSRQK